MRLFRLAKILAVSSRYGLDEMVLEHEPSGRLAALSRAAYFWRSFNEPRAVRLRKALEALGPIFVKFGQVLSTRRDLLPLDMADELARLQDRVPPISASAARAVVEKAYGRTIEQVYSGLGELLGELVPAAVKDESSRCLHEQKLLRLLPRVPDDPTAYERVLRVTDFISGMTDSYAVSLYRKLRGISLPGSVRV